MKKQEYLKRIKEAKGNNNALLALNMKLATDMEIASKDKQKIFKEIIKAKKN